MANPLLLDIVLYLQSVNLVEGDGVDAFRDFTPDTPDQVVLLKEYVGSPAVPYDTMVNRSVQIKVRSKDADTARALALQIYKALYSDTTIVNFTSERWGQVHLRQPPFKVEVDKNDRILYGFNIGVSTTIE